MFLEEERRGEGRLGVPEVRLGIGSIRSTFSESVQLEFCFSSMHTLDMSTTMLTATLLAMTPLAVAISNQGLSPGDIPYMLEVRSGTGTMRHGFQSGRVGTIAPDRLVIMEWTASRIVNQPPDWSLAWDSGNNAMGMNKAQSGRQEFSTRFHPTTSCVVDEQRILIGGVTASGRTVIEEWSVGWPEAMPAPFTNPATGIVSVAVALPSVTGSRRLYEGDEIGRKLVRNLCALRRMNAAPESCLVQFHDSNDVYSLSLHDSQLRLLASAVTPGGTLGLIPGLSAKDHHGIGFGDRIGVGYKYTLIRGHKLAPAMGAPNAPPVVILLDDDRNGAIDVVLQLSGTDYRDQGWLDLGNYANWWLN